MLARIRRLLAPPFFEGDPDKTRVAGLLNTVLLSVLAVALLAAFFLPLVQLPVTGVVVVSILGGISLGALFLLRSGHVRLAGGLFTVVMWIFSTAMILLSGGIGRSAAAGYVTTTIVASLLLGSRAAVTFAGLGIVAGAGFLYAELSDLLPPPTLYVAPVGRFLGLAVNISMAGVLLYLAARGIAEALSRAHGYAAELEEQRGRLEETVQVRTRDLTRRTRYLEVTAEIAQEAAGVLDVQELLTRVAISISERFGFYHAGIFLVDASGEWAVMQAASSAGGARLLASGHRLRVSAGGHPGEGIVGYVTGRNRPRVALDVGKDAVFFDNPDLPETRSEMALPLRARGEVIGALDVQSREPEAFSDEDVAVLQTLADQVALAISNARLFRQAQESLAAERRAYGELSLEAWRKLLRGQPDLGFLRNEKGTSPAGHAWRPEMDAALQSGVAVASGDGGLRDGGPGDAGMDHRYGLAIPIKVGRRVIGVVNVQRRRESGGWSPEELQLMETLSEQLGVALESARLYADTQRRAANEQLIGEVTARMRATLDMDTVLQTAVQEMRQALGYAEVEVLLGTETEDE